MTTDRPDRRVGLWALGGAEAVTFVLLLITTFDNHPGLRAGVGFVHGCIYLLSLAVAGRLVGDNRTRGLAVIPGIGALLMARALTRPARSAPLRASPPGSPRRGTRTGRVRAVPEKRRVRS